MNKLRMITDPHQFRCPQCSAVWYCGCGSCRLKNQAAGRVVSEQHPELDCESCGHCGHTDHPDGWLDEEVRQAKVAGVWPVESAA